MYITIILCRNYLQIVRSNYVYFGQINESVCLSVFPNLQMSMYLLINDCSFVESVDSFKNQLCNCGFFSEKVDSLKRINTLNNSVTSQQWFNDKD